MATRLLSGGEKVQQVHPGWGSGTGITYLSADNPMPVAPTAKIDTKNSTTSTLSGAAVFTGVSTDVTAYATITVFVDSNVDGTLAMQLSTDGINWDRQKVVVLDQDISSGSVHTLEVVSQFFRVVFTNGAGAQGHFRLQTLLHSARSGFLTSSPDEKISKINDAQIVRVSNEPLFDIARGLYADKFSFHRFGHNTVVPNGSYADIWTYGPTDPSYNWPAAAETLRVKAGGNAADTGAGAGARTIQIVYLDSIGAEVQEQLTLAGASASGGTSSTATRFLRAWVDSTGTANSNNTAAIIIENSSTNLVLGEIPAGQGQTGMTHYTVPFNHTAYLTRIDIDVAIGTNKDADVRMWQRRGALTFSAPFGSKRIVREWFSVQGDKGLEFSSIPSFPALTDIWFEAQGNGATTKVSIDFDIILVRGEAPTVPQ